MSTGDKIYKLRKEKGLSQEELAEALNVSRQSISKWESGSVAPDIDKIVALSEMFNVSTDFLIKDQDDFEIQQVPDEPDMVDVYSNPQVSSKDDTKELPKIDTAPVEEASVSEPTEKKKGKKSKIIKIVASALAACLLLTAVIYPIRVGGIQEAYWSLCGGKVQYPYVLVHGLGGWGEGIGINNVSQYWGGSTGSLSEYLTGEGYQVYEPTIGPISSNWDRTCELYAQLTGTTVDYGEAHSKAHNHERYGRTYDTPLFEGWGTKKNGGQRIKINLIGHSFGGNAVRTLAYLLEYGDQSEKDATGSDTSPLFTGGKGDWVNSVTTLCAPNNGSSLTCVIDSLGSMIGMSNTTDMLASLCFGVAGVSKPVSGVYDFMLDQFGIGKINGGYTEIKSAIAKVTASGNDHAGYDLSPDGAAAINSYVKTVKGVYYFSYAYCTTHEGTLLKGQVPNTNTLPVLYATALGMGTYTGTTKGGINIDASWQKNDGLVSIVSAMYPTGQEYVEYTSDKDFKIKKGIWNYMGVKDGDHGTVIGLNADTTVTHQFYDDLFSLIDSLKR